ncbi:hypothetical protein SLEP1_g9271 [Rubroshorea leprosula]|uniref:Uncharacterized protein n=1 Tax=Rubroshorea leprosula TaxID=152421 RepID=A0AAV5IA32_9ROSI|nr:hypothetical protein SLEP1_g9271 [Rubroshorea leprosula]
MLRRRRRLPLRSTIEARPSTQPRCLGSEDVIHIRTRREREITVLPQISQHTAGDGAGMARQWRSLSSLLPQQRRQLQRIPEDVEVEVGGPQLPDQWSD